MSHDLARALRVVYDDVDGSDTGQPSRATVESIAATLRSQPDVLKVMTLWSAARALVYPQVLPGAVEHCARAIASAKACVAAGPSASNPAEVQALLQPSSLHGHTEEPHLQAQACLGHALAYCVAPDPARFTPVIDALVDAQRNDFARAVRAKQAWIGWLDDVASRSDRFTVPEILDLLERALHGTLDTFPPAFEWEGVSDGDGVLEVWATDPKSRRLVTQVMRAKPLDLVGDTLIATILDSPLLVRDPLRVEYFIEHVVHRLYLGDMYAGLYRYIEYRCLGTGETWRAPA